MPPTQALALPQSFISKKKKILEQLAVPTEEYDDLSPKGSVDVGIRDLIDEINTVPGLVTTSSCAGRISVFLEGKKSTSPTTEDGETVDDERGERAAGVGGKGNGGRWLFVSHDPVSTPPSSYSEFLGMETPSGSGIMEENLSHESRLVHFKFEPMILHILTASLQQAQVVLSAALQAGFRESGALGLLSSSAEQATPMVGIRSMGLALESVVGFEEGGVEVCIVPEFQLRALVELSNQRFKENTKRIERFRSLLEEGVGEGDKKKGDGESGEWEDVKERRERKKAEGLERGRIKKESALSASEEMHGGISSDEHI